MFGCKIESMLSVAIDASAEGAVVVVLCDL